VTTLASSSHGAALGHHPAIRAQQHRHHHCAFQLVIFRQAKRVSGSGLSQSGDLLAAGEGDPGDVDARLLLGMAAGLAV